MLVSGFFPPFFQQQKHFFVGYYSFIVQMWEEEFYKASSPLIS